ncbi:hypothetical protein CO667_18135 [Rhizobium sp. L43]|nr:hypothetical protein CO667_18135 [Rhizobium sp. L43]
MATDERKVYRNEYVLGQMAAINANYGKFEAGLTREMQSVSFASTVSNIALTTVASQVTPVGTKDILTATAAGLTGVKAAYDKDVLLGRTIQIIQHQMQASRDRVGTRILKNLGRSTDEYPLMMAWMDLQDYYRAGTVTNGLVEAEQAISVVAADAAETRAYTVIEGLSTTDSTSVAFFNFIYAGNTTGPPDLKRKKYLDALLSGGRHDSYFYFTDKNQKYDGVRKTLIGCMSSYGGNAPCKPGSVAVP